MLQPSADLLVRLDRPGPRYTSYPTAPVWRDDLGDAPFRDALARVEGPVSVYVHVPFCKEQCWFCACNQVVSGRQDAGDRYLDALERQIDGLTLPSETVQASRVHLGGGTPTWLSVAQLDRLVDLIDRRFPRAPGAEFSVEIDPDVTTDEQIDRLAARGMNRVSVGVQSTDERVLTAIHRPQDTARVRAILARARAHGMRGLNVDLVYGLPHQDEANFGQTLDAVMSLRPDRLAVYSYAHVPWMKAHQQRIDEAALPGALDKMGMLLLARERALAAGYVPIGMDHFALPDDELAVAARAGDLHRNFMGYTTMRGVPLVGLGVSAISEVGGVFAQQQPHLGAWYRAVFTGAPSVIHKSYVMTDDDALRADVIAELMCNLAVDVPAFEDRHGVVFAERFADAWAAMAPLEADGLVTLSPTAVQVTETGRLLLRNVAMCFDGWLGRGPGRFSRTV